MNDPSSPEGPGGAVGRARQFQRLAAALALAGWVVGVGTFLVLIAPTGLEVGGDLEAYVRAGDDLVAGRSVYVGEIGEPGAFSYAPPWAVLFAALSWVPDMVMQVGIMVLGLLAIRYVAGSWLWSGLVFLYPVSVMVLLAGNIEFLIAGAIVLAAYGRAEPLTFMALAKISPMLGVPPARWRQVVAVLAVSLLVTLPWLYLWPEWLDYLLRQPSSISVHIGPPWYQRLPFALALLLLRRPWAAALAVMVAIPSLWLGTLVILSAVVRLWFDGRSRHTGLTDNRDGRARSGVPRPRLVAR